MGSKDLFEGLDDTYDLSRLIRERSRAASAPSRMKVLMLTAAPLDEVRVRTDQEYRDIVERIQQIRAPKVILVFDLKTAVRSADVLTHLLNSDADIFHFSGHAGLSGLVFEDALGNARSMDGDLIASVLSKMTSSLKCAVLNACLTDDLANRLSAHLSVVIGCNATIDDEAAIVFSRAFYQSLAAGRTYRDSFDLAISDVKMNGYAAEASKYICKGA
jgi:hypothetical protein